MQTPIDTAHAAMVARPQDDAARLAFFERLADAELVLMLTAEPEGEQIAPELFAVQGGRFVLAFDAEERLAAFAGRPVPYAALPGRVIAALAAGQGIGLGLNLGAGSETLLGPDELGWLAEVLEHGPAQAEGRIRAYHPPDAPDRLVQALAAKLARAAGLARAAWLVGTTDAGGGRGHLLAFDGARPEAQPALARAVHEALVFSGIEAGALDVTFLPEADPEPSPAAARIARVALRLDIPEPPRPEPATPAAPGTDPDRPPRLR